MVQKEELSRDDNSVSVELLSPSESKCPKDGNKYEEPKYPEDGDKCEGCTRYWDAEEVKFVFQEVKGPILHETSFLDPVYALTSEPNFCTTCKPCQLEHAMQALQKPKKSWIRRCCEVDDLADFCEESGHKKYNPIWTGEDPNQIGVFVRNLKIEAVNEEEQSISIHFIVNFVWLDAELCKYVKSTDV